MRLPILAALAALALPAPAAAQGCIGAPLAERGRAVQLQAASTSYDQAAGSEGGLSLGASFRHNPRGFLAYSAEYHLGSVGDGGADLHSGGVVVAARAPLSVRGVSLCARAGALASRLDQGPSATRLDNVTFPVGVVLEAPLGGGAVVPYVAPQYLFSRTRGAVLGLDYDASGDGAGVEAGAGIRAGRAAVTLGGTYSALPEALITPAASTRSFFVRLGLVF